jgi:6-phosphogluconolactonase
MSVEERAFDTLEGAASALAGALASTLCEALSERGRASLVVSGGRTPGHVFRRLRQERVDWARVTVTLSDERWVPPEHPDSNERLVRSFLLQGAAEAAKFVPLYGGEISPEDGQAACEARLTAITRPFDAVYLGLGEDGHFASLFPETPALDVRDRICVAVPGTESRQPRMTLTAPAILDARDVFLMFSGAQKEAAYAEAKRAGSHRRNPLRLIFQQERTPVTVFRAP